MVQTEGSDSDSSASGSVQSGSVSPKINSSPKRKSVSERSSSASRSVTQSPRSPSRSGSPESQQSHNSPTNSPAKPEESVTSKAALFREDEDSRSQSPNLQIDDHASTRSRSRSRSATPHRKSRSHSHSSASQHSRSSSRSRSSSGSKSISPAQKKRRVISSSSDSEKDTKKGTSPEKLKKSRIIDSESDNESVKERQSRVDVTDIFGDADDISASSDEEKNSSEKRKSRSRTRSKSKTPLSHTSSRFRSRSRSHSLSRSRSRSLLREDPTTQREDEIETVPETRIDVEIPRIVTDLGKDIHFVKLPNFLSVDTRPFDSETYEDEIDEEETMDEEGRQRIKLKVSNTIRWREYMNDKGDMVKESNARFVRWSDGSMSLHLGNEIFDVYKQPLHGDHNHMFIRQGTGLQGQAVFRTKFTFRPHSTESFTHKKMTMSLADRSQKTSGIKILTQVGKDPTTDRHFQLKKEEEKLRQAMRSQHRPQPKKKKTDSLNTSAGGAYHPDDGSDDENAISLSAIKNKYKKGVSGASTATPRKGTELKASAIYSSDEDEGSDFEKRRHKKIDKTKARKALRDSDSESEAEEEEEADSKNKKLEGEKSGSGSDSGSESRRKSSTGSGSGDESRSE